jgi:hypothetical protein
VAVKVGDTEEEIAPTLNLNMVVKIVLALAQQLRQRSVVSDLAPSQGAIPLGPTLPSVLYHVVVGARDIELEIAPTLNLNTVVKIALKLENRYKFKSAISPLALFMVTILHGQRLPPAVLHVVLVIGPETGLVQNQHHSTVGEIVWGWIMK